MGKKVSQMTSENIAEMTEKFLAEGNEIEKKEKGQRTNMGAGHKAQPRPHAHQTRINKT